MNKDPLKEALNIPGMKSHIVRKKAYWGKVNKRPRFKRKTVEMWVNHRLIDLIVVELHHHLDTQQLLNLYRGYHRQ